jgi:hypothetical protein
LYGWHDGYRIEDVDVWTFIWLLVILKIPILFLFLIVRWAVRQTPEAASGQDGGVGPRLDPMHPHRPRSPLPRSPRRGPHGGPFSPPARIRTATIAARATIGPHLPKR